MPRCALPKEDQAPAQRVGDDTQALGPSFENVQRERSPDVLPQLFEGSLLVPFKDSSGGLSIHDQASSQDTRTMCRDHYTV